MYRNLVASAFSALIMVGGFACGAMLGDAEPPPRMQGELAAIVSASGSTSTVRSTYPASSEPSAALSVAQDTLPTEDDERNSIIGLLTTSPDDSSNMWGNARPLGGIGLIGSGSTYASSSARRSIPSRVDAGTATVSGPLPIEVIRRIVQRNNGRHRLCYEQALSRNPRAEGRVVVRFAIATDGAVHSVADAGSSFPDRDMIACMVSAFRGLTFPRPANGIVLVVYPFSFKPGPP